MTLFQLGSFKLHSGATSAWKIECDALTDADWDALAEIASERIDLSRFVRIVGIPSGGLALAARLKVRSIAERVSGTLWVDDVLTTGASFSQNMQRRDKGLVVFARGRCPEGVTALFQMGVA